MEARRLCLAWLCICLALSIPLIIAGVCVGALLASPNGELPLWYEVSTCNDSSAVTVNGYGGETGVHEEVEAFTRSYWLKHAHVGACPAVMTPSQSLDIALKKDDGYRPAGVYGPNFLLPTDAYALLSLTISDSAGNQLLPTTHLELGPSTTYPWRLDALAGTPGDGLPAAPPPAAAPPDAPPAAPPPGTRLRNRLLRTCGGNRNSEAKGRTCAKNRREGYGTGGGLGDGFVASDGPVGSRSGTLRNPLTTPSATLHADGVYMAGGRSYYAGGRAYGYHHGLNAYMPGIAVSVRDASTKELDTNYDRFELTSESYIDVPDAGGNWPLTLTVHNATLFSPETATRGGEAVFVAMYTTSGDECVATPSTVPGPPGSCPQPTSRTTLWSVPRLWTQPPARSPLHLPRARYAKISEALLWSGYAVLIVVCAGFFCLFCFALCCD